MTDGIRWAKEIHNFMVSNTSAFLYWWLVTEKTDGEGLVNINTSAHTYTLNKRLFTLGNYARFVRPDNVRFDFDRRSGGEYLYDSLSRPGHQQVRGGGDQR